MTRKSFQLTLSDGGAIHARLDGPDSSDAPLIVFSNSVMTDLSVWDAQVEAFADRLRILRYDQRGHGASSQPLREMDFDAYGADLRAVLGHVALGPAIFVGLSMGVPTGLAAYHAAPDLFCAFVAVDGVSKSAAGREAFWTERRETARAKGMALIAAQTAPRWLPDVDEDSALAASLRDMIAGTHTEGFAAATGALQSYDYSFVVPQLSLPFAAIAGAKDGAMPDAMRAQFGAVDGAVFETVPNAGHIPNFQEPQAFNAALGRFLDRISSPQTQEHF